MPSRPTISNHSSAALEARISHTGHELLTAVEELVSTLPASSRRPADVSRAFRINKDLSSRLLIALGKRDALAAAYYMPGPEALRKLIQTAASRKAPQVVLDRLRGAVAEFEALVREQGGGRGSLAAIISAWVPEARARFEMESKQAAFRGMSQLRGTAARTMVQAAFLHPSAKPERIDGLGIVGYSGLRRLRPGAPMHISTLRTGMAGAEDAPFTVAGERIDAMSADMLLREFCSEPTPEILIRPAGSVVHYLVAGDRVGLASAIDLFLGEYTPAVFGMRGTMRADGTGPRHNTVAADIEICTEELVFDTLVHEDIWPGVDPDVAVYDTSMLGRINPNDRERDIDRMDLLETTTPLGRGVQSCRIASVPRYVDMLRSVCAQRGWKESSFRCYRCHVHYPVYGTQVHILFAPPVQSPAPQA